MNTTIVMFATVLILLSCSNGTKKSDAYGNFESTDVFVSSENIGKIVKLDVEEGETIEAGKIVAIIDTAQLVYKKEQLLAQKQVIVSKTPTIQTQINVQEEQRNAMITDKTRIEKLLKDNAVPQKQLDDIESKIKIIDSQIASIKSQNLSISNEIVSIEKQIEQLQDQITRCYIKNPIKGTVLEKYAEETEITTIGRNIYKIANLDKMILRVYISGSQLSKVKVGNNVKVLIDKSKNELSEMSGTISWVSSQAEFTPKTIQTKEERVNLVYALKVIVINDGSIKIGMPGEVKF